MRIAGTISAIALTAVALVATGVMPLGDVAALIPDDLGGKLVALAGLEPAKPASQSATAQSPVPGCDRPGCPIEVVRTISEVPNPVATVVSTLSPSEAAAKTTVPATQTSAPQTLAVIQPLPRPAPTVQAQPGPVLQHDVVLKAEVHKPQAQALQAPALQPKRTAAAKPAPSQSAKRTKPEKLPAVGEQPEWTRRLVFERQT